LIKHCKDFIDLINQKRYYDAHEILEEVWFPKRKEKSADILLIKGFINASVSFELKKRGRVPQALKVWENYKKYLPLINECSFENRRLFSEIIDILEKEYDKLLS